jgi:hypothetical protein
MSLDHAAGSRAQLADWKTGAASMALNPVIVSSGSPPATAFSILGNGHVNRPPQAVISYLNAASFRITASISGEGLSASFDEVIDLGRRETRGQSSSVAGTAITSLKQRWQFAIRSPETAYSLPDIRTDLQYFDEDEDGVQEEMRLAPFVFASGTNTVAYYPASDMWTIAMPLFLSVNDGDFGGSRAAAGLGDAGTISTDLTAFGAPVPMGCSDGATVSGAVTVESWLPVY